MVDRALFLGDGDGRLLRQFVQSQPGCQVTTVDQSNRMLQRQSDCLEEFDSQDTIRYLQSDARDLWLEPKSYDLLVTAFFVDCFPESQLEDVLPRWLQAIRSGGYFYFVDFSRPTAGWRRFRAECYLDVMHRFFRLFTGLENRTLVDFDSILERLPISLVASKSHSYGLISSRLYKLDAESRPA